MGPAGRVGRRPSDRQLEVPVQRRLLTLVAALILASIATTASWTVTPVDAAAPTGGPVFNDPTGSEDQQMAIMNKIMRAIDGTRRGATIRMAFYSFTIQAFADKLIAAHKRGVRVRLIMDDHEIWPAWESVVAKLGRNPRNSSYAVLCHGACLTENQPSYQHTKTFMFSSTGGVANVVMVSSANPTYFQARRGWNNGYAIVGDKIMYDAFVRNFETMAYGARKVNQPTTQPHVYFTATSGKHKIYFFPKDGAGGDDDPMYGILGNIGCTGLAAGYGSNGRTTIRIAMYQWSILRVRLADRIWSLDDRGCKVTIMFDPTRVDPGVLRALTRPGGRHGGPTIVPAATDEDDNGVVDQMVHDKFVLINGAYSGDNSAKVVFTGSANWTNNALRYNDEYMLRIWDNGVYNAFAKHWDKVRAFARGSIGPAVALKDATNRRRTAALPTRYEFLSRDD
jgi:phosphatidylserine/phosphatidylglycerophosphate/cardiolipin synthase-like enzyme